MVVLILRGASLGAKGLRDAMEVGLHPPNHLLVDTAIHIVE